MRFAKTLVLILLLCQAKFAFSQADSILSVPPGERVMALLKWYRAYSEAKDSLQVMNALTASEKLFEQKADRLLQKQAWLMRHLYNALRKNGEEGPAEMIEAAGKAGENGWDVTQAECWYYAGDLYFRQQMPVPAFEYMLKAQQVFDKYTDEKYEYTACYAYAIGNCYYHFGEFREAISYAKKTLMLPAFWGKLIRFQDIQNMIALCYQQLKQYDSAAIWYRRSYETATIAKDSFYMTLANGNLGYTYYLQQQYDKALPLLEADCAGSLKAKQTGSAANAAVILTAIYIKKGELASAEKYMDVCREFVYSSGSITLFKSWYENLYNLLKAKGDYKNAGLYADSVMFYRDSVAAMRDKKAFNQAVLKIEMEKHLNEVNQLDSRRKQQILLRNSLLIGLALLAMIALLWVNRQLLKRNKEKEIAGQQLRFAEQELISYTQKLKEKSDLLEQLRDEVSKENDSMERTDNINRLLATTILTEDDWRKFRELFEKVYPGFFITLKEKLPDLSPTETRLLALIKLQLAPKDMALMLGVSYDAIRKARQRLLKKINLPEEGGLKELLEMIRNI